MSVTITDPAPALIQRAAIATGMPAGTILSYSRKRRVSYIRFAIWYVMRTKHGFTYSDIAAHFNRDHSAIIYGIHQAANLIPTNAWLRALVSYLSRNVH